MKKLIVGTIAASIHVQEVVQEAALMTVEELVILVALTVVEKHVQTIVKVTVLEIA